MNERYELAIERIRSIVHEDTVAPLYRDYFQKVAGFAASISALLIYSGLIAATCIAIFVSASFASAAPSAAMITPILPPACR